jgi:hypothetical protein
MESDDLIQIDDEYLLVTAGLGTTGWTVSRGYAGSAAASHLDAATVTRLERGYTDASRINKMAKADIADASYLQDCADQANSWLNSEVGQFYGPSTDTQRTYDVESISKTLKIPGGIRSLTTLEIKTYTSESTWHAVAAGDIFLRPHPWDRLDGLVADKIVLADFPTGQYWFFYYGSDVVRPTGVFGPPEPPNTLRRIADSVGWWLYQSRDAGGTGIIGQLDTGELVVNHVLTAMDVRTIQLYRNSSGTYSYVG